MTFKDYYDGIGGDIRISAIDESFNGRFLQTHSIFYWADDCDKDHPIPDFRLCGSDPSDADIFSNILPDAVIKIDGDSILVKDTNDNELKLTFFTRTVIPHCPGVML